ncbi:hypothetical protein [uncultured Dechloromonas sp.]|uniref:hypothetical protein n=1 Tax=uncultured Dechloromonas sp. TaxID=171719 RepID=UPI0025E1F2D1|nr:hypothetical protein [uncultured Dechloromonas sp.]
MKSPQEFELKLERHFLHLTMLVNRHLMDHLRRISNELEMDFQSAYLWGTLSQMNLPYARMGLPSLSLNINAVEANSLGELQIVPVRLADLSQVTKLPKETVRRKLENLRQRGKVERNERGEWWITRLALTSELMSSRRKPSEDTLRWQKNYDGFSTLLEDVRIFV